MHLYKRGAVWWCAWPENGETKRESTRCRTRDAAELWFKRKERELADPTYAAAQKATFAGEATVFLSDVRASDRARDTVEMYECKLGHAVRLRPERLVDIETVAIDAYFVARRSEGASGSTLHKEWVALRGVLRSAKRRKRWTGELDALKPAWISPASKERKRRLTWSELRALLAQLDDELGGVVRFAVATGARRAELARALERDADGLAMDVLMRGSKTDGSWARIPVPPIFRDLLPQRAWLTRVEPFAHSPRHMFPNLPHDLRCLNAACKRARIAPVTYNDLRRTFGSLLIEAGVTNTVVARLLRHTTTQMVDRVYGKVDDGALRALVEAQTGVLPVYVSEEKRSLHSEAGEPFFSRIVGQDRLELSANGLREPYNSTFEAVKRQKEGLNVRRAYVSPRLSKSVRPIERATLERIARAS